VTAPLTLAGVIALIRAHGPDLVAAVLPLLERIVKSPDPVRAAKRAAAALASEQGSDSIIRRALDAIRRSPRP
jgi:hypothetical protein